MMVLEQAWDGLFTLPSSLGVFFLLLSFVTTARALIDGHEEYRDFKYVLLLFPAVAWSHRRWLFPAIVTASRSWLSLSISVLILVVLLSVCCFSIWSSPQKSASKEPWEGASPFLLPARTSHTRLFPKKHSFSYSYLLVAVPVGWYGSIGSFFSADTPDNTVTKSAANASAKRSTWFSVDASDYLDRGTGYQGLEAKLVNFIHSQGVDPARYTSAWLVTAPRFLGFSFNPVSFWYLYRGTELDAMVLEVNNTFDERRMYFLTRNTGGDSVDTDDASFKDHKFRSSWIKDFHVSPFNSRKGSYALSALEPSFKDGPWVDNTITLKSSKDHAKLVARIFSTQPAIRVQDMSAFDRFRFVVSWFWVGFATSPRILREAARLFFQRKLHVWYRPEVSTKSIGRNETERERAIESVLRDFLREQAGSKYVRVWYIAAGNVQPAEEGFGPHIDGPKPEENKPLTLHILTPLFYTHIALAPSIAGYLQRNAAGPVEERTFACDALHRLVALLSYSDNGTQPLVKPSLAFRFLAYRRQKNHIATDAAAKDSPSPPAHDLDRFVLAHCGSEQQARYRRAATALVLADGMWLAVWDAVLVVARIALLWLAEQGAMHTVRCWCERCPADAVRVGDGVGWITLLRTMVAYLWYRRENRIDQ